jgi:KDO2-lipid IV(A) lauroyltransferase
MKNAPVTHAVEFGLFQLLKGLVRALPHRSARRLGRGLGDFAYRAMGGRRRTALRNLELALPELDDRARERIGHDAFRHMISHATELLSWGRFGARELCRQWTLEGWEHVGAATSDSRAAFLMTAHFGHWELLASVAGLYVPDTVALVRPLDNQRLERQLSGARGRFGVGIVYKHGAARRLVRHIRQGGRMIILIDQRVRERDAVVVPFFGRPARTTNLIARLALKHETPVVPIFVHPETGGRYRVVARPAIEADADGAEPIAALTARYMGAVEAEIRSHPELWMWMHDRWKMT